ncbi:MAG: DUF2304 domain-containing protein, partial [Thaumarchaeota archaeon]|nr:DUF2304 domain-containing protein [Nitrososphaerota archaeon]
ILAAIFTLFALSRAYLRFKERKLSSFAFIFWFIVWIAGVLAILFPETTTQLSRLDVYLSPAVETTPEFGLFLTELLYRHGINIGHTYIGEETVLILDRADGPRAYDVLREEIDKSRTGLVEEGIKT